MRFIHLILTLLILTTTQLSYADSSYNLHRVTPKLFTSGQPSEADFQALKERGVNVVINLRGPKEKIGFDEASTLKALKMQYIRFPISSDDDVNRANASRLHAVLQRYQNDTVLVHCSSSNRAGALFALIAATDLYTSNKQAIQIGEAAGMTDLKATVIKLLEAPES